VVIIQSTLATGGGRLQPIPLPMLHAVVEF